MQYVELVLKRRCANHAPPAAPELQCWRRRDAQVHGRLYVQHNNHNIEIGGWGEDTSSDCRVNFVTWKVGGRFSRLSGQKFVPLSERLPMADKIADSTCCFRCHLSCKRHGSCFRCHLSCKRHGKAVCFGASSSALRLHGGFCGSLAASSARPVWLLALRGSRLGRVLGRLSGLWTTTIEQL